MSDHEDHNMGGHNDLKGSYTVKKLCCNEFTHNPSKMLHCEDFMHSLGSLYPKKRQLDYILHIESMNTNDIRGVDKNKKVIKYKEGKVLERQIFDHRPIQGSIMVQRCGTYQIFSMNIEGLCHQTKYIQTHENRKHAFLELLKKIGVQGGIYFFQELFLKSEIKLHKKEKVLERIQEFIGALSMKRTQPQMNLKYHWDGYTNLCIYDANIWNLVKTHEFKRINPASHKMNTMFHFSCLRDKTQTPVYILHCHLKAYSPVFTQNMRDFYQYLELYHLFQGIRKKCKNALHSMISIGDHNNENTHDIYTYVLSTFEME